MKTLATLLGIIFVALAGFAGYQVASVQPTDTLGAFRPSRYSGKLLTRLNSGGSESSFNTTPCTTPDGQTITANAIGDFIVITVNPGAANEEKISASTVSCSGTTLTWTIANRGLSFASATSTITANKKQHAIGETVIISNDDQFLATQYVDIDGVQTIAALKTFTSGAMFSTAASSTDECTGTSEYCTKDYIDNSVNQGAATSTEAIGGIVELATATEQASSTPTTPNIPYVLQAQNATSTPTYSCNSSGTIGALCTVIARNSGKIHQTWIDLTEAFTWTGHHIFSSLFATNASSTNATSTNMWATGLATAAGTLVAADPLGQLIATSTPVSSYVGASIATSSSVTSVDYNSDYTYTTPFQPTTIVLYLSANGDDSAGSTQYTVSTNVFNGTSCIGGLILKNNALNDTMIPSATSVGCALQAGGSGAINWSRYTASITSVTSTGFTVRVNYYSGSSANGASMSITPVAYR